MMGHNRSESEIIKTTRNYTESFQSESSRYEEQTRTRMEGMTRTVTVVPERGQIQGSQEILTVKPKDADFECDISLIQDRPDFRVTAHRDFRTFVNTSKIKRENLKIQIIKDQLVRVEAIPEDPYSRPFIKEIPIPFGCLGREIDVTINRRGILMLLAPTDESRELNAPKPKRVESPPPEPAPTRAPPAKTPVWPPAPEPAAAPVRAPAQVPTPVWPPAQVQAPEQVRAPAPVQAPAPVRAPVPTPAPAPVPTPVRVPSPVQAPTPVRAPPPAPVAAPVRAPAPAPIRAPSPPTPEPVKSAPVEDVPKAAPRITVIKPTIGNIGRAERRATTTVGTPWGERFAAKRFAVDFLNKFFEASVEVPGYAPHEIKVNIDEGCLRVAAKAGWIVGVNDGFQNPTFTKEIQVPDNINPTTIKCYFDSSTGILNITTAS